MPNETNKLIEGLLKGASAFHQGYLNNLYREDAQKKSQNIMERLQYSYGKNLEQNERILGIQQDMVSDVQTNPIDRATLQGRSQIKPGELGQLGLEVNPPVNYTEQMGDTYLQGLAELSTNPYGKEMTPYIQKMYERMTAQPKREFRNVGNDLLEMQPDGSWKTVYSAPFPPSPYTQIKPRAMRDENDKPVWQIALIDKETGKVTYTYAPATEQDLQIQEAQDYDNSLSKDEEIILKNELNPPRKRSRTNNNSPSNNLSKTMNKNTPTQNREYIQGLRRDQIAKMSEEDLKTLEKSPYVTKEQVGWVNDLRTGKISPEFKKDPQKPIQSQIIQQKKKEYEGQLKNQSQQQALDSVLNWFDGVTGPDGWGRSDLTKEQWLDEIGQEDWNDIEWQILKQEFYKITNDNLDKYFQ